jgi:hypothetical protein
MVQWGLGYGRARGGGTMLHCGNIDGRPGKINSLILTEDGLTKDGGSDFLSVCNGVLSDFSGPFCVLDSPLFW